MALSENKKRYAEKILKENNYSEQEIRDFVDNMTEVDYEDLKSQNKEGAKMKQEKGKQDERSEGQKVMDQLKNRTEEVVDLLNNLPECMELNQKQYQEMSIDTAKCLLAAVALKEQGKEGEAHALLLSNGVVKTVKDRKTSRKRQSGNFLSDIIDEAKKEWKRFRGDNKQLSEDVSQIGPSLRRLNEIASEFKERRYRKLVGLE